MTAETWTNQGWICPICHSGVAPSCVRCPCAYSAAELLKLARPPMTPILGERRLDEYRPVKSFHDGWIRNMETGMSPHVPGSWDHIKLVTSELHRMNSAESGATPKGTPT